MYLLTDKLTEMAFSNSLSHPCQKLNTSTAPELVRSVCFTLVNGFANNDKMQSGTLSVLYFNSHRFNSLSLVHSMFLLMYFSDRKTQTQAPLHQPHQLGFNCVPLNPNWMLINYRSVSHTVAYISLADLKLVEPQFHMYSMVKAEPFGGKLGLAHVCSLF